MTGAAWSGAGEFGETTGAVFHHPSVRVTDLGGGLDLAAAPARGPAPASPHTPAVGLGSGSPNQPGAALVVDTPLEPYHADGCVRYPSTWGTDGPLSDTHSCTAAATDPPGCAFQDLYMEPPCSDAPWDPALDDPLTQDLWLDNRIEVIELDEPCEARVALVKTALYMLSSFAVPGEALHRVMYHIEGSQCDRYGRGWPNCVGYGQYSAAEGLGSFLADIVFQLLAPDLWARVVDVPPLTIYLTRNPVKTSGGVQAQSLGIRLGISVDGELLDMPDNTPDIEPNVFVNLVHPNVEHILGQWLWGSADERVCAALRLSAFLLHELLHLAHLDSSVNHPSPSDALNGKDPFQDTCNPWLLIVNTYLFAAANRLGWHSASGAVTCCPFGGEEWFFNDCWPYYLYANTLPGYPGPGMCVSGGALVEDPLVTPTLASDLEACSVAAPPYWESGGFEAQP